MGQVDAFDDPMSYKGPPEIEAKLAQLEKKAGGWLLMAVGLPLPDQLGTRVTASPSVGDSKFRAEWYTSRVVHSVEDLDAWYDHELSTIVEMLTDKYVPRKGRIV